MTRTALRAFHLLILLTLFSLPLALVPVVRTMNPPVHSKELAARFLLALSLVAVAAAWPRRERRPPDLIEIGLALVFLTALVSAVVSGRFAYCVLETWHLWTLPLLALALMRSNAPPAFLDKCSLAIVAAGLAAGVYGSSVYFGFDVLKPLFPFAVEDADTRNYLHSFQGNPEYYGSYIAPVAVLALSRVFVPGLVIARRAGWAAATVFLLFTLVLSGTRGALGGFAIGAAIVIAHGMAGLHGRARLAAAGVVGVLGATAVALFVILSVPNPLNVRDMRLARRFVELFDVTSDSVKERILFYSVASRMIAANPVFGSGPGTFRLEFYPEVERLVASDPGAASLEMAAHLRGRIARHAHNDYLETWCTTGTLGFGALLLVLAAAVVRFARRPPQGTLDSPLEASLRLNRTAFFAAGAALFLNAAFSFPLQIPDRAALAWLLIGLFFAADGLARNGRRV